MLAIKSVWERERKKGRGGRDNSSLINSSLAQKRSQNKIKACQEKNSVSDQCCYCISLSRKVISYSFVSRVILNGLIPPPSLSKEAVLNLSSRLLRDGEKRTLHLLSFICSPSFRTPCVTSFIGHFPSLFAGILYISVSHLHHMRLMEQMISIINTSKASVHEE